MSLSRKKARKIVVGDVAYLWAVSEDSGYSVVVVQHDTGSGQKLEVTVNWSDSASDGGLGSHPVPITPSMVSNLITEATRQGWSAMTNNSRPYRGRLGPDGMLAIEQ